MNYTLVIGASLNEERISNLAVRNLLKHNHNVYAIGNKAGKIYDTTVETEQISFKDIHTITLYLNANNQKAYYDYILKLNPQRIIFNPGAENEELENLAKEHNIKTLQACTLVMLSTRQY